MVRDKITKRMDDLQNCMEGNEHLSDPLKVKRIIVSVRKFWSVLNDEDRDYIHAATDATEEKRKWE